jgi:hypothetical protein
MHIVFLTSEYPHPKLGKAVGLDTSIKNLSLELQKGHVKVYDQNNDEVFIEDEIAIYKIAHKSFSFFDRYLHRKFLQKYINKIILENII